MNHALIDEKQQRPQVSSRPTRDSTVASAAHGVRRFRGWPLLEPCGNGNDACRCMTTKTSTTRSREFNIPTISPRAVTRTRAPAPEPREATSLHLDTNTTRARSRPAPRSVTRVFFCVGATSTLPVDCSIIGNQTKRT